MRAWLGRLAAVVAMACCAAPLAQAQTPVCHGAPSPYRLFVTTQGVRSSDGYVVANLYGSDQRRFLAPNGWLSVWRDPAQRGEVTTCIYLPAPGRYAAVVFHDNNASGVLEQGPLGIPKKGFGFSNNVVPILSAPSLSSVSFAVAAGDTRLRIALRYL